MKKISSERIGLNRAVEALSVARPADALGNSLLIVVIPLYVAKLPAPWFPRALGVDQNGRYLLVVNERDVVDQRPVKVGAGVNGLRVVEEGLQADDWVAVNNLQRARPGAKVTPVRQEAAPTAATATPK